jgi:nicotinate phosphoribosyltransferase
MRGGRVVCGPPDPTVSRARAQDQLRQLHAGIKRFDHPHQYPVGLEERLHALKTDLMLATRRVPGASGPS